jgi:S-adenosylmethionine synthetase
MDYSGNMICRYIAKNIVAAGIANTANVDISYSIGVVEPTSVNIELDKNKHLENKLVEWVKNNVGLEPYNIIKRFDPTVPRYAASAINGNYGRTKEEMLDKKNQILYPWENLDLVKDLKQFV